MEIALYLLGGVLLAVGVAGVVLPVLPGGLLLVAGAVVVAWAEGFTRVGFGSLAVVALLGVLIWTVDWIAAVLGARAFGASRWAVYGGSAGLLVGLFLGPAGILLGPAVGAVAFEYARNPDAKKALEAGAGVFLGFLLGSAVKVALAFVLIGVVGIALAW